MKIRNAEVFSECNFTDFVKRLIKLKEDGVDYEIYMAKGIDEEDVAIIHYFVEVED